VLLVSFLLVIVATVLLLSGLFLTKDLPLIFMSIGCSALAGLVLVVAVLRSRPRPAAAPAYDVGPQAAPAATAAPERAGAIREPAEAGRFAGQEFPIGDYDNLEVVEVLPLLNDLEPAELEMVRQREASGRAHPWVLARIDALLESEGVEGELAADRWGPAEAEVGVEAGADWGETEPEWAGRGSRSEWAASDFPLESQRESYDEIEVVREFPIDGYAGLNANQILPLLSHLDSEDLKMVREEEAAGKARTSILSRIDVLLARELPAKRPAGAPAPARAAAKPAKPAKAPSRAAANLPIENYDSLTVPQITSRLAGLSAAELKQIRTYEKRHKARHGVIQRIEAALARAR
jgi:hypothetical protein